MNKLIAALVAGAFAFASTAALSQDKTAEPAVKAPTKAEKAAAKEAKAQKKAAAEQKSVAETKAEKKAKDQARLKEGAVTENQGDQSARIKADTAKNSGPAKPTKAERQQDLTTMEKNAGKAGQ